MSWLGLDIGGANLKIADHGTFAHAVRFALWRHPDRLGRALADLLSVSPHADSLAITMTGELADCFASKADGVRHILQAVSHAAPKLLVRVYLTDGRFVSLEEAAQQPHRAAASNWHALARFASRLFPSRLGLVLDVGSTTTDMIPVCNGQPLVARADDTSRLMEGTLVYSGVLRSPVCALAHEVRYRGSVCPLAQEIFAHTRDVYVLLGQLDEDPDDCETADGQPLTRAAARLRLARSVCADGTNFHGRDAAAMAQELAAAQQAQLLARLRLVLDRLSTAPASIVLCGQGEFLARQVLQQVGLSAEVLSLSEQIGERSSRCAPAHAVAALAWEEHG